MDIIYLYVTYLNDPEILFWLFFFIGGFFIADWYAKREVLEEVDDE